MITSLKYSFKKLSPLTLSLQEWHNRFYSVFHQMILLVKGRPLGSERVKKTIPLKKWLMTSEKNICILITKLKGLKYLTLVSIKFTNESSLIESSYKMSKDGISLFVWSHYMLAIFWFWHYVESKTRHKKSTQHGDKS